MSSEKHRPLARGDACQVCKKRKVRCPGEKPACSRCVRLKKNCEYVNPSEPSTSSSPSEPALSSSRQPSIPTPSTFNEDVPFDNILSYLSVDPGAAPTTSSSAGPSSVEAPPVDVFGFFPKASNAVPEFPAGWNWDWSTVDLTQLLGQPQANEAELSDNDRDHLLLVFFSNFNLFGMMVYFPTFYANMHSTNAADHPHPCLLYAMFLVSCQSSNLDYIRAKEDVFYRRARTELDNAIQQSSFDGYQTQQYDAARAASLIALWLFFRDKNVEGWVMLGQATRLAICCGLDRIPTSTCHSDFSKEVWPPPGRNFEHSLPQPKTRLEMGERICAFWCLYFLDRCAATALHFAPAFDAERVSTPLPRVWAEYESSEAHGAECDEHLRALFRAEPYTPCQREHRTEYMHLIKAVTLMHSASIDESHDPKIEIALQRFVDDLEPNWKQPITDINGYKVVPTGTASLQFMILGTEMYMAGADMRTIPNPKVLGVVRRMMGVLTLLRDRNLGDHSVFIATIWTKMARILLIESKRLERDGDSFGAASLDQDVDFVVEVLKQFRQGIVQNSVYHIGRWKQQPVPEFFQEQIDVAGS